MFIFCSSPFKVNRIKKHYADVISHSWLQPRVTSLAKRSGFAVLSSGAIWLLQRVDSLFGPLVTTVCVWLRYLTLTTPQVLWHTVQINLCVHQNSSGEISQNKYRHLTGRSHNLQLFLFSGFMLKKTPEPKLTSWGNKMCPIASPKHPNPIENIIHVNFLDLQLCFFKSIIL